MDSRTLLTRSALFIIALFPLGIQAQKAPDQPVNDRVRALVPAAFPGFVYDKADVLSAADEQRMADQIRTLQSETKGSIAVVTLPSLNGLEKDEAANDIGRLWKVGGQGEIGAVTRSLGAVVLIVPKTPASGNRGQCFVAPATGAQGFITDNTAGQMCRDAVSYFKTNDYAGGISGIVAAISERIRSEIARAEEARMPKPPPAPFPWGTFLGWFFALGVIVAAGSAILMRRALKARAEQERLDAIRRAAEAAERAERARLQAIENARLKREAEAKARAEKIRWDSLTPQQQRAEIAEKERLRLLEEARQREAARLAAIQAEKDRKRRAREAEEAAERRRSEESSRSSYDWGSSSSSSSSDWGSSDSSGSGGSYDGGGGGSSW